MSFAKRLRALRVDKKLSQAALSSELTKIGCPVSKSSINMYERGEREPGFETLEAIADFFNVDMNYLLGKSDVQSVNRQTPYIDDVYLSFAKRAQDEGIDPSDIQLAIDTIKRLRGEG